MDHNRNYLKLGITIFGSLSATIAFFFFIFRYAEISAFCSVMISALRPVLDGIVIAYLLSPAVGRLERCFTRIKALSKAARALAVLVTLVLAMGVLVLFCALVVPQLIDSVGGLVDTLPGMLEKQLDRVSVYLKSDDEIAASIMQLIETTEKSLLAWIRTNLFSTVSTVANSLLSIGSAVVNMVVAVVVTVYLLMGQEHYLAQCRKLFYAVSRNKRFNRAVMEACHQANRIFSGFISGKLLDSLIVGIICFVCLSVMRMPYTLLISVIVGVTNIIPMFGPFIGAIPSAFLLLLVSPSKCLLFLVFIIILQQVDGNIIGPKILGDSTGLSSFWVMFAIIVGGGLFGFMGMLFGVPTFAVIYYLIQRFIAYLLGRRGLPSKTTEYTTVTHVDPETRKLCSDAWSRGEGFRFGSNKKSKAKKK